MCELRRSVGPALLALYLLAVLGGERCLSAASPELPPSPVAVPPLPSSYPVDPPTPAVTLRVRVPATAAAGQDLEYHLHVENCSPAPAHHVLVRNPLPANARFVRAVPEPDEREPELRWRLGTLEPCACREIVLVLAPTGTGDVENSARVQFEHGECVRTHIGGAAKPAAPTGLTLAKTGPAQALLYDVLTYRLTVTNGASTAAAGVALTDTLPEGLEPSGTRTPLKWDLGTLEPGQTRTVEYQAIAKKAGRWTNQAVVTDAAGERREASAAVVVGAARLELTKSGPARRYLNRPATYQVSVRNTGTMPATGVVVADLLPEGVAFVSASEGGRREGGEVRWLLGTVPPGARRTVQVVLRAISPGEVVNRATATADRDLKAEAQAATVFEAATGLTVDVDDQDDPVEVGAETKYTITVVNQGAGAVTRMVVRATVPEQMDVTAATGPPAFRREGRQVVFAPITLRPREEKVYEVSVKAVRPGDVRFKVDLTADQLTAGPVHREESTTIYNPNIAPP
jgi:uncharacterized repeat protein (TIGR01451 family)